MKLDTLYVNGLFYTMESEGKTADALGVRDGRIVFVGDKEEVSRWTAGQVAGQAADQVVDLQGNTVIPGMADSHMHMYAYCQNQTSVNLEGARSLYEMILRMKEKAEKTPPGKWIKGVNFDQTKYVENRFPTKEDLDGISTVHPIVIKRCCLHAVVANSMALAMAGVGKGYDGGTGGIVEVDEAGEPNGILREQSTKVFDEIIPDPLSDPAEKKEILQRVLADMSAKGITAIHTYAAKIWKYDEDIELYRELARKGELPVRVTVCIDELFEPERLTAEQKADPYRMVQYGNFKIFSDGSLGSRSAALMEPYNDDAGNSGFVVCDQEALTQKVLLGYRHGLAPAIHAIGDRALDMTVTAIEEALRITKEEGMSEEEQKGRLPFRIIHVQMVNESLVTRMKKLPLVLDIQPVFLCTDLHWIEDRIGAKRLKGAYAWKTMERAGLIQTGGSDCPVESYDPITGIFAAATRCDRDGYPVGGYLQEEKLSVYEAVSLFTKNVHFATGQQDQLGTLEVGKFADFAVLDRDPFKMGAENLLHLQVLQTYVAGKRVFVKE